MRIIIFFFIFFSSLAYSSDNVLNVYNWSGYIPSSVLRQFTKETGVKINYSTFTSNEELYTKIKSSPQSGYDVIVPGAEFISKLRKENLLLKLDKSKLPNIKHLNPFLLNRKFDPHNEYSLPYLWGSTGIVINTKYHKPGSITRWSDLWKKQYIGQLLLLNGAKEVFPVVLKVLGYSNQTKNPEKIKQAYLKLKKLLPNVKLFNSDATQSIYINENVTIGMSWNGDAYIAQQENPNIQYIYPKEGVILWIDSLSILKNAPHKNNAYRFINFIMRPDIAKKISLNIQYSSPNLTAIKQMPDKIKLNPILYPSPESLKNAEFQNDVSEVIDLYLKYWEQLKLDG